MGRIKMANASKWKHLFKRLGWTVLAVVAMAVVLLYTVVPGLIMARTNKVLQQPPYTVSEAAGDIHRDLLVADLHSEALLWNRDLLKQDTRGHLDVPRMEEGNTALQVFSAVTRVHQDANPSNLDLLTPLSIIQGQPMKTWFSARERALHQAYVLRKTAQRSQDRFALIETREDLDRYLERRGEDHRLTAGYLAVKGLHCLEGDRENARVLFHAGFRMMAPVDLADNALGGSSHGKTDTGLSDFGRDVIRFIDELKVLIDLAHASPQLFDDVLDVISRPVVVSHAGVRGICDTPGNLSDAQLKRIAESGGVVGIGFWEDALCASDIDGLVQSIRYTADLIGVEHVALGSNFDGGTALPFDATGIPLITEVLLDNGFRKEELARIMGGNIVRLLRDTLPTEDDSSGLAGQTRP
jgi:microsomal dipeptidase-like Zn-dependent dipeptidase